MTRQRTTSEILRSITGGLMVGLGLHILSGNVDRATTQLSQSLGINTGEVLGLVPCGVRAASQGARVLAGDDFGTAQSLLSMVLAFWPLLLAVTGDGTPAGSGREESQSVAETCQLSSK